MAGCATFAFGIVEIHDIYQILQGQEITTELSSENPKWVEVANKITIVLAKVSLVLSAGVSYPGVFIISTLVGRMLTSLNSNRHLGLTLSLR